MGLVDLINVGTALSAGAAKGFADGVGIELGYFDYILPATGALTQPTIIKLMDFDGSSFFGNLAFASILTGVGYVGGRTAAYFVNHYQ